LDDQVPSIEGAPDGAGAGAGDGDAVVLVVDAGLGARTFDEVRSNPVQALARAAPRRIAGIETRVMAVTWPVAIADASRVKVITDPDTPMPVS